MSLRPKIVIILSAVVALYALLDHGIQRTTVSKSFAALERDEATKDVQRVVQAIENEIEHLDARCRDWATWDDSYGFALDGSPEFVAANLGFGAFRRYRVNLLFVCARDGRVVWGAIQDPASGQEIALRDFPQGQWSLNHPLIPDDEDGPEFGRPDSIRGILLTERGPMIACSRPLHDSLGGGASRGTVVMGRFLAEGLINDLVAQTQVTFDLWALDGSSLPEAEADVIDRVTASYEPVVVSGETELAAYATIADIQSAPGLLVRADVPRDISARGASSVRYGFISTIAAGFLILLVLLGLMQRTVLTPIAAFTQHAVSIGKSDDYSRKLNLERTDEIGILSSEFDTMMEKLETSRRAVVFSARQAGMSEIATGILHNVGNVLNSVNVSANVITTRVNEMSVADLERLTAVLTEQGDKLADFLRDDPRGKHLTPYINALSQQLTDQRSGVMEEITSLNAGVEHIRELISAQQSFAVKSTLQEATSIPDFLEKALTLSNQAAGQGASFRVIRDLGDPPSVYTDQHKLLEILVNIVQNARHATADVREPELGMRIATTADEELRIEITDNGVGIREEHLDRIFNHGFTTKEKGHGFGLHAAANAAKELGGSLSVRSDGPGQGATFILQLPVRAPTASATES